MPTQSTQWGAGHGRWGAGSTARAGIGENGTRGLRNERGSSSDPHTSTSSSWARTSHWGDQHLLILHKLSPHSHLPLQTQVHSPPPLWGLGPRPPPPYGGQHLPFCPGGAPWPSLSLGAPPGREGRMAPARHHQGPQGPKEDTPLHRTSGETGAHVGPGAEERPPRRPRPRPARAPTTAQKLRT